MLGRYTTSPRIDDEIIAAVLMVVKCVAALIIEQFTGAYHPSPVRPAKLEGTSPWPIGLAILGLNSAALSIVIPYPNALIARTKVLPNRPISSAATSGSSCVIRAWGGTSASW